MTSIFLDTNIFLHFLYFDQIDWLKEGNIPACEIVISPFVIDELDKRKVGNSKISNRARSVLQKLELLTDSGELEVQKNVHLNVLSQKPLKSLYDQYGLNSDEPDQRILASIIDYRLKNPSNTVMLCSDDIGPRLRAKSFSILTMKLRDSFRLPTEESELEKKIKKLEQENYLLKTRIPKLRLNFHGGEDYLNIKVNEPLSLERSEFIQAGLLEIKNELPYLEILKEKGTQGNILSALATQLSALSPEQVDIYNTKLDEYFEEFEKYLDQVYAYEHQQFLSYPIKILLTNDGNVPGEEIDIHLHFPDGFEIMEPDDLIKNPKEPDPPYRPKNRMDFGPRTLNPNIFSHHTLPAPPLDFKFNHPEIKRTNSYEVDMYRKYIKHSYSIALDDLVAVYQRVDEIKNYRIDYKITAANMPEGVSGKLNVIFEK